MRLTTVATCNLNQWAMDFEGNLSRIKESIRESKKEGAIYRLGPELEITGYGCEDHFLENDTSMHSWECIAELLDSDLTNGIICDIGMPVEYCGVRYNCRMLCLNKRILLIRPKMHLANDGNYRETRWFSSWKLPKTVLNFRLPQCIISVTGQTNVTFGDAILSFNDTSLASETCEELFTPHSPHITLGLNGVEIIGNGSASHHQLRKLSTRLSLMQSATSKNGGVYLYANQKGCDGGRLYYDGCACVVVNGNIVAQASQFSLKEVEVVTAIVDLDLVSNYRGGISSMREQSSEEKRIPSIDVDFNLSMSSSSLYTLVSPSLKAKEHAVEEEIGMGPACWLWDYLRRSGACGFLLPLSGGADSSSVAAIVGCMCQLVIKAIEEGDNQVLMDAIRIGNYAENEKPVDSKELSNRILHTVYMGTVNSSDATKDRSRILSSQIGAYHLDFKIDTVISSLLSLFTLVTNKTPKFKSQGGSSVENLALQNIQARMRMVIAFLLAQLLPWVRGKIGKGERNGNGFLLVLASANVDEALRGYLTKYDCSSGDINPIGGISKTDLRRFLLWAGENLGYPILLEVEKAPPTAELEPITSNYTQVDEVDMGMTYAELSSFGRLRKIFLCGPVSMFTHLCSHWHGMLTPADVATKVKTFFKYYSMNRHKMTTLTPSYHAENYSPEDNRYDLRQFLYNVKWPWQFKKIDQLVAESGSSKFKTQ